MGRLKVELRPNSNIIYAENPRYRSPWVIARQPARTIGFDQHYPQRPRHRLACSGDRPADRHGGRSTNHPKDPPRGRAGTAGPWRNCPESIGVPMLTASGDRLGITAAMIDVI
jgi:hypothetical protein